MHAYHNIDILLYYNICFLLLNIIFFNFQIDYGIFLDDYTANMLLDHFIEHKMYKGEN